MYLIRTLIGLLICITMLPICSLAFKYTSNLSFDYSEIEDEIALCQLREVLLIAYDMEINYDELNFIYKNKRFSLSLVNNKLLLQPGTQMFLNDVDYLYFVDKDDCIYVNYEKDEKEYERIISSSKGFYLDDFSDCDVHDSVSSSIQE